MAKKITRTFTTYRATALKVAKVNGTYKVEEIGSVEYTGMATTPTEARKALAAAGFNVPRGTEVDIAEVKTTLYEWDLDDIMPFAHVVEDATE